MNKYGKRIYGFRIPHLAVIIAQVAFAIYFKEYFFFIERIDNLLDVAFLIAPIFTFILFGALLTFLYNYHHPVFYEKGIKTVMSEFIPYEEISEIRCEAEYDPPETGEKVRRTLIGYYTNLRMSLDFYDSKGWKVGSLTSPSHLIMIELGFKVFEANPELLTKVNTVYSVMDAEEKVYTMVLLNEIENLKKRYGLE